MCKPLNSEHDDNNLLYTYKYLKELNSAKSLEI